ncbi:MAG TPA: hypothetical protein PLZ15_09210 [Melioribacteraceae bacterium]|nr:hypothetical protein [Melioribacteraceae bacterium]
MSGLVKHSSKIEKEAKKQKPVFVNEDLYYGSDLTFTEVYLKCKELCLKKMVNVDDLTIQGWYVEFLKEKWNSEKFNQRLQEMVFIKTYGERIDISQWFEKEAVYTAGQVAQLVESKINSLVAYSEKLLTGQEFEIDISSPQVDLEAIKYTIAKKINLYYDSECRDLAENIIEQTLPKVLEDLGIELKEVNGQRIGIGQKMKMRLGF